MMKMSFRWSHRALNPWKDILRVLYIFGEKSNPWRPSFKLLQNACVTAGRGKDRDRYWKAPQLGGNSFDKFGCSLVRMKDRCVTGFLHLCPLTEINRHNLSKRCLLEVNALNILIIFIPHFLMAKSWLALPSYRVDPSRWDAYVHSSPRNLGRARCSAALIAPGSPSGCNTQLHPTAPKKQAQLLVG